MVSISSTEKKMLPDAWVQVGLMAICLAALTLGNGLFHTGWIRVDASSFRFFLEAFALDMDQFPSFSSFLWFVILYSRKDILCVFLISCARFVKIPGFFISLIFFFRSALLGFCGAFFIGRVGVDIALFSGFFAWMLFFSYHALFLSAMICFGAHTLARCRKAGGFRKEALYWLTVGGEMSLVILLNMVYCFLNFKI